VSRKSERLVNLTIVLLASRRYLTKAEIFSKVEGYEGSADARDRMFERDKDELRQIGITIEVGSIDPYFEDELGYRIKKDSYALQIENLTPVDLALLSLAREAYDEQASSETTKSALLKLKASGIEPDSNVMPSIYSKKNSAPQSLKSIIEAISKRGEISFDYLNEELQSENRSVYPYQITHRKNRWFLIGYDLDRDDLRTFRLDRITGEVSVGKKSAVFEIDHNALSKLAEKKTEPEIAEIKVRRGRAHALRQLGELKESGEEWDLILIPFWDAHLLRNHVLWEGTDAIVVSPLSLRDDVINALQETVKLHG
jgi:proteasome accessory factor B